MAAAHRRNEMGRVLGTSMGGFSYQGVIGRRDHHTVTVTGLRTPNGHSLGFVEGVKFRREAE